MRKIGDQDCENECRISKGWQAPTLDERLSMEFAYPEFPQRFRIVRSIELRDSIGHQCRDGDKSYDDADDSISIVWPH